MPVFRCVLPHGWSAQDPPATTTHTRARTFLLTSWCAPASLPSPPLPLACSFSLPSSLLLPLSLSRSCCLALARCPTTNPPPVLVWFGPAATKPEHAPIALRPGSTDEGAGTVAVVGKSAFDAALSGFAGSMLKGAGLALAGGVVPLVTTIAVWIHPYTACSPPHGYHGPAAGTLHV